MPEKEEKDVRPPFWDLDISVFRAYTDAIVQLENLKKIGINRSVLDPFRKSLIEGQSGRKAFCTEEMLLVYELEGFCKGIHKHFDMGAYLPKVHVRMLWGASWRVTLLHQYLYEHIDDSKELFLSNAPGSFRAYLLDQHFSWVHISSIRDGDSGNASSCFCPSLACLLHIFKSSKPAAWLLAATNLKEKDTSPLAFAWNMARRDPQVGQMTADVAALVQMGRIMASCAVVTEQSDDFDRLHRGKYYICPPPKECKAEGSAGKKFVLAAKNLVNGAKNWIENPVAESVRRDLRRTAKKMVDDDVQQGKGKVDDEQQRHESSLARVKKLSILLSKDGELYAECIERGASKKERIQIVFRIRETFRLILRTAEPNRWFWGKDWEPASVEKFSRAIDKLARSQ